MEKSYHYKEKGNFKTNCPQLNNGKFKIESRSNNIVVVQESIDERMMVMYYITYEKIGSMFVVQTTANPFCNRT